MNKLYLKNYKKNKSKKILFIFLLLIAFLNFIFYYFNKKALPLLTNYASIEMERIVNIIINNATTKEVIKKLNTNELITIIKNNNGEIQTIYFDSCVVNDFLNDVTDSIQDDLIKVSRGDMSSIKGYQSYGDDTVFKIPLGVITNNVFLNNLGPKIPVKLELLGYINSTVDTNIKEYGINNALIEIFITIDTKTKTVLPFSSKDIIVTNKIPIAYEIINGHIPDYYQDGFSKNSNLFSLPLK